MSPQHIDRVPGGHSGGYAAKIWGSAAGTVVLKDRPNTVTSTKAGHVFHVAAWVRTTTPHVDAVLRVREVSGKGRSCRSTRSRSGSRTTAGPRSRSTTRPPRAVTSSTSTSWPATCRSGTRCWSTTCGCPTRRRLWTRPGRAGPRSRARSRRPSRRPPRRTDTDTDGLHPATGAQPDAVGHRALGPARPQRRRHPVRQQRLPGVGRDLPVGVRPAGAGVRLDAGRPCLLPGPAQAVAGQRRVRQRPGGVRVVQGGSGAGELPGRTTRR